METRGGARLQRRILSALAVLTLALGCGEPSGPAEAYRPHVVIVMIDALRADRLGVDGYPLPTSPNLDAVAADGAYFSAAMAHSTWTKPSIASFVTSLYPSQHGIQVASLGADGALRTEVLDDGLVTLAERFQEAGYTTGAIINQVHLQRRFGFAQGYDHYDDKRGRGAFRLNKRLGFWLDSLEDERPIFAYVHYLDVHWPFTLRLPENEGAFGSTEMESKPPASSRQADAWVSKLRNPDDLEALQARYDHEVAYADAAFGQLVDDLRERGLYEDTLLLVTSDHGEGFMEHGRLGHGLSPHEEQVRVPLIVRLPERMRGQRGRIERPVGLIDLFPTLLDLLGLEPEVAAQGESLAPLLRGESMPDRVVFADTSPAFAARSRTHKLIWFEDGTREFYDLVNDPEEQDSQVEPCRGACRELAKVLRPFRRLMLQSRQSNPAGTAELKPEDIETLRALGYLD